MLAMFKKVKKKKNDSFGFEHILKMIKNCIGNKNIISNMFKKLVFDLITCRYDCTRFIDFMLNIKSLVYQAK